MAMSPWKHSLFLLQESSEFPGPHSHLLGPAWFGFCHSFTGYTGFLSFYSEQAFTLEVWSESKPILQWLREFWWLFPSCIPRFVDGFFSPSVFCAQDIQSFLSSQLCAGGLVSARCSSWNCKLDLCPQVVIKTPILGTLAFQWASVSLLWLWFPSWFLALGKFCPAFELRYVLRERKERKWYFLLYLHSVYLECGGWETNLQHFLGLPSWTQSMWQKIK